MIGHAVISSFFGGLFKFLVCFSDSHFSEFVRIELGGISAICGTSEGAEYAKCGAASHLADVVATFIHRRTVQVEDDTFQQASTASNPR